MVAARAGARKVIGVEFSDFAIVARKVVTITIVHGKVENIQLPDDVVKVDVIVAECYLLIPIRYLLSTHI